VLISGQQGQYLKLPQAANWSTVINFSFPNLWHDLNQRFSTQNTPRPIFWRKKSSRSATEDFHHLAECHFQRKSSIIVILYQAHTTCLKSTTTRRLRNTEQTSKVILKTNNLLLFPGFSSESWYSVILGHLNNMWHSRGGAGGGRSRQCQQMAHRGQSKCHLTFLEKKYNKKSHREAGGTGNYQKMSHGSGRRGV